MSELLEAAQKGTTELIQHLLDRGEDINVQDPREKNTPLMIAIQNQRSHIASYLIERGADVNLVNVYQQSALTLTGKQIHIAKQIIDAGYDQYTKTVHPAIHQMVKDRNIHLIKYAAAKGWDMNVLNKNGETILFDAIKNSGFLAQLLKANLGLNLNFIANEAPSARKKERSPLYEASLIPNCKASRLLMDYGADINASFESQELRTPLMNNKADDAFFEMIYQDYFDKINLKREDIKGFGLISYAVFRGDIAAVEKLLAAGADINHQDAVNGLTPLMTVVRRDAEKSRQMIAFLIQHHADLHRVNHKGETALDIAKQNDISLVAWIGEQQALHERELILQKVSESSHNDAEETSGLAF